MKTLLIKFIVIFSLVCVCATGVFAQTNDALAEQSIVAIRSQKLDEALQICKKILESEPTHPKANYACGAASHWLKNPVEAEKYLIEAEKTIKDTPHLYTFLGSAYYANRAEKHLLADLNTSLDYLAKSITLNPKSYNAYNYRSKFLLNFHGINGLSSNPKLKDTFYSDLRMVMQLVPEDLSSKYDYAKTSTELGDFGQAIPVFAKLLASPLITKEATDEVCSNAIRCVENADSEARLVKKIENPTLWSDGISLMKGCKNASAKFETDETRKKEHVSKFREKIIYYHQAKAKGVKSDYLASPEYLAEVTEAINDGDTKFYDKRIEVYTFRMQFAKADADKKSKVIAEEKDIIVKLTTAEKSKKQAEEDFKKGEALKPEDFKTVLEMKKSRLALLDRIIALNIPQTDKDAFSARRTKLADVIHEAEADVANAKSKAEANEREQNRDAGSIDSYNKEANEAARLYKNAGQRSSSIDDCRMLIDNYKKKCVIEKLQLNIRDIKNALFYMGEARKYANNITNYETKRNFLEQADKIINTIENSLSVAEKTLRELPGN